ncbi:hypothetical protein V497_02342 [Pseudogymnoascus sp. VKM F-4516 (FW-969)]|nr:hypothetical protein V497_02342 [Pseudogymnoascus sp. VKM F-4516 (FW-969)]
MYANETDETEAICKLLGKKLEQYTVPAKIIVYRATIERTQALSQALGCRQYYCEAGNRDKKGAIMDRCGVIARRAAVVEGMMSGVKLSSWCQPASRRSCRTK